MGYRKAADVLPKQLIAEIQKYIDGEMLYIPRKCEEHSRWERKAEPEKAWSCETDAFWRSIAPGKPFLISRKIIFLSVKSIQRILREKIPPEGKGTTGREYN